MAVKHKIDKKLFISAGVITLTLFILIYMGNEILNYKREARLLEMKEELVDELEEIKALTAITNLVDEKDSCTILQTQLKYFDKSIWDLGLKLDNYEEASRNIFSNPYYEREKKRFIVNQVLYLSMLEKMKRECGTNTPVTIIYIYANSKECKLCDDQSFVLTDINKENDEGIAVFSIDIDIQVIATEVLSNFYNVSKESLPCTIIEGETICGFMDKKDVMEKICAISVLPTCQQR